MTTQNNAIVKVTVESRQTLINDVLYIIDRFYRQPGFGVSGLYMEQDKIVYSTGIGSWYWGTFNGVSTQELKEFKNNFWKNEHESKFHIVFEWLLAHPMVSGSVYGRITLADRIERALKECTESVPFNGGMYLHFGDPEDEDTPPTLILEYPTTEVLSSLHPHIINNPDHNVSIRETFKY